MLSFLLEADLERQSEPVTHPWGALLNPARGSDRRAMRTGSRSSVWRLLAAAALGSAVLAAPALALPPGDRGWHFIAAPYLWLPSMDGEVEVRGQKADVHVTVLDMFKSADLLLGLMGHFEARNGRLGLILSPTWTYLKSDEDFGPIEVESKTNMLFLEGVAAWRILGSGPAEPEPMWFLDALAGVRWTYQALELDSNVALLDTDERVDWLDPIVGARVGIPLGERFSLRLRGDIGGFGAGSELSWQAIGTLGYRFRIWSLPAEFFAGYRSLKQDYQRGSGNNRYSWDINLHGPLLGLALGF